MSSNRRARLARARARLARARRTHARLRTLRDGAREEAGWAAEVAAEVGDLDAAALGAARVAAMARARKRCAEQGAAAAESVRRLRARAPAPAPAAGATGGAPVPPDLVSSIAQIEQATRRAQAYLVIDDAFNFG